MSDTATPLDLDVDLPKMHIDVEGARRHSCADLRIVGSIAEVTDRASKTLVGRYRVLAKLRDGFTVEDGNGQTVTLSTVSACSCNCK